MKQFTNRLINETSPYLLQHAHNPVDWFPWGDEAFQKARDQNKAIFLSIGYSSCHWCHVMEHESFENEEIAAVMNTHFINIKVDREERPDIDQVYMQYVQVTTGSGGWPMSLFLTPDQKPFYGGTYFPPHDAYGRPGFKRVLKIMADYYSEKDKLASNLAEFDRVFADSNTDPAGGNLLPDANDWQVALQTLATFYEPRYGGIGRAPKFPAVNVFDLFLRHYRQNGDKNYLNMTTHTLKNMATGGIYDQAGGGFSRYSVDEHWLVPHFEKMLYDNGQLVCLYLDTYVLTKEVFYLEIARETLAFVSSELLSDEGGFYSSLDADSEGEEGRFYVWTKKEIYDCLGKDRADIITTYYGVSEAGNFEGKNILNVVTDKDVLARQYNLTKEEVNVIIASAKKDLLKEREKRVRQGLDDKVIASWNGLMLSAYAKAYQVTREKEYATVIEENISFIQNKMLVDDRLKRTYKKGQARYDAFIEDYACLIRGILDAYEALFDAEYIALAEQLVLYANLHFWDVQAAGYYTTADNQEKLVVRMKDIQDSSIPSASGLMILNNLRLFYLTENRDFYDIAEQILTKYASQITENPYSYSSYLAGLDFFLEKPKEIVIVKKKEHSVDEYLQKIYAEYIPNKSVMVLEEGQKVTAPAASIIKEKKTIEGKITAYVCHNFSCSLPQFQAADLIKLLLS